MRFPNKVNRKKRIGASSVEFAIVAPIFFLTILGGIEFASVHITQCAMENAAFEGARKGITPGATNQSCVDCATSLMQGTLVKTFSVSVEPSVIDASTDFVRVSVSVPMTTENKFGLSAFMNGGTLTKTIELSRQDDQ